MFFFKKTSPFTKSEITDNLLTFILTVAVIMNVYRELREGSSSIIPTTATELSKAC